MATMYDCSVAWLEFRGQNGLTLSTRSGGTRLASSVDMNAVNIASWILAQNEERHDVATSPELALIAGFSFEHVLAAATGRTVVSVDVEPVSSVRPTMPAKRS